MEHSIPSPLYLDHVTLFRTFDQSPINASSPGMASNTRTPKERSLRILEEQQLARRQRVVMDVGRPKYMLDEVVLGHPKPAAFFIEKARAKSIKMRENWGSRPISATSKSHKQILFRSTKASPVRSPSKETNSMREGQFVKANRVLALQKGQFMKNPKAEANSQISDELGDTLLKSFVQRDGFLEAYTRLKKDGAKVNVFTVCKEAAAKRKKKDKLALFQWTASIPFFSALPKQVVEEVCNKLQAVEMQAGAISRF